MGSIEGLENKIKYMVGLYQIKILWIYNKYYLTLNRVHFIYKKKNKYKYKIKKISKSILGELNWVDMSTTLLKYFFFKSD